MVGSTHKGPYGIFHIVLCLDRLPLPAEKYCFRLVMWTASKALSFEIVAKLEPKYLFTVKQAARSRVRKITKGDHRIAPATLTFIPNLRSGSPHTLLPHLTAIAAGGSTRGSSGLTFRTGNRVEGTRRVNRRVRKGRVNARNYYENKVVNEMHQVGSRVVKAKPEKPGSTLSSSDPTSTGSKTRRDLETLCWAVCQIPRGWGLMGW